MPIYFAQFVVVEENLWLSDTTPPLIARRSERHRIATQVFSASDAEAAYERACEMVDGFSDRHNDGPGDTTHFSCAGLHDLAEISLFERTLEESLNDPYGIDVGLVDLGETTPEVRTRAALSLFARQGTE